MLKTLLRYEWRATARTCIPVYLAALVLAVINRLFSELQAAVGYNRIAIMMQGVAGTVYFGVIVAVFVVTFVILVQRFYKSLLGDEGYLMFTLPVSTAQHIWAKGIVAMALNLLAGVAAMLSVMILAMNGQAWLALPGDLVTFLTRGMQEIPSLPLMILEFIVLCLVSALAGVFMIYLCIAIGHLARRHRIAMAVGAYFAISTITQIVLFLFVYLMDMTGLDYALSSALNGLSNEAATHVLFLLGILLCAGIAALFFYFTNRILSRHLNLE